MQAVGRRHITCTHQMQVALHNVFIVFTLDENQDRRLNCSAMRVFADGRMDGWTDGRMDRQMDRQTDGYYQVHYLPALLSYTVDNKQKKICHDTKQVLLIMH